MSRTTDPARILPISDLVHSRDESSKLRLAGIVTAISPSDSSLIVLTDPHPSNETDVGSIVVDLSLCTDQTSATGGWSRKLPQVVPPEMKSMIMVIGHLVRREVALDITFLTKPPINSSDEAQIRHAAPQLAHEWPTPNKYFVLEAILVKVLDHSFDLKLWNYTARQRSQHEWQTHRQDQQQHGAQRRLTDDSRTTAASPHTGMRDTKGKRKALD